MISLSLGLNPLTSMELVLYENLVPAEASKLPNGLWCQFWGISTHQGPLGINMSLHFTTWCVCSIIWSSYRQKKRHQWDQWLQSITSNHTFQTFSDNYTSRSPRKRNEKQFFEPKEVLWLSSHCQISGVGFSNCKGDKDGFTFGEAASYKNLYNHVYSVHLPSNKQRYTWMPTMMVWEM